MAKAGGAAGLLEYLEVGLEFFIAAIVRVEHQAAVGLAGQLETGGMRRGGHPQWRMRRLSQPLELGQKPLGSGLIVHAIIGELEGNEAPAQAQLGPPPGCVGREW